MADDEGRGTGLPDPRMGADLDAEGDRSVLAAVDIEPASTSPIRVSWLARSAAAGLVDVTARSVLLDRPSPLSDEVIEVALAGLTARVGRAGEFLDADDRAAWARLLDPSDPEWLGIRTDLALLSARTVHGGVAARAW